jgi:hypothetical protein
LFFLSLLSFSCFTCINISLNLCIYFWIIEWFFGLFIHISSFTIIIFVFLHMFITFFFSLTLIILTSQETKVITFIRPLSIISLICIIITFSILMIKHCIFIKSDSCMLLLYKSF